MQFIKTIAFCYWLKVKKISINTNKKQETRKYSIFANIERRRNRTRQPVEVKLVHDSRIKSKVVNLEKIPIMGDRTEKQEPTFSVKVLFSSQWTSVYFVGSRSPAEKNELWRETERRERKNAVYKLTLAYFPSQSKKISPAFKPTVYTFN